MVVGEKLAAPLGLYGDITEKEWLRWQINVARRLLSCKKPFWSCHWMHQQRMWFLHILPSYFCYINRQGKSSPCSHLQSILIRVIVLLVIKSFRESPDCWPCIVAWIDTQALYVLVVALALFNGDCSKVLSRYKTRWPILIKDGQHFCFHYLTLSLSAGRWDLALPLD